MAKVLQNIFVPDSDEIAQNFTIESWHVSQSVDALTGAEAYDITISGSLELTGSFSVNGLPQNSGAGYYSVVVNNTTGQFGYSTSVSSPRFCPPSRVEISVPLPPSRRGSQ